ncbi:hypothetical protein [Roseateles sp. PN1]|uniref:hypothetical protein n=1 Tax=Roseateles sp. PN1 TaxID=3137372 RepID=UPI003139C442
MSFEIFPFWRGVSSKYDLKAPTVNVTRLDRKPKNSGQSFHKLADAWFEKRFGIPFRSQALHVTSRLLTARTYGATPAHVMRIIPLSDYQYCWSEKTQDLLFGANALANCGKEEVEQYLESMEYRTDGLEEAHASGHEVMLRCGTYIAIPMHMLEHEEPKEPKSLIVLSGG